MKKLSALISALLITALLCGCSASVASEDILNETETEITEVTTEAAEETSAEKAESETTKEEITSVTETETPAEETEAFSETEDTTDILTLEEYSDKFSEAYLMTAQEYGNDIDGYIWAYPGWIYEEDEYYDYVIYNAEDTMAINVSAFVDESEDLLRSAYVSANAVLIDMEIEGYENYHMVESECDGMPGYFAVMTDEDTDLGFMYYAIYADYDNGWLRCITVAATEMTIENSLALSISMSTFSRQSLNTIEEIAPDNYSEIAAEINPNAI